MSASPDQLRAEARRHIFPPYAPLDAWLDERTDLPIIDSAQGVWLRANDGREFIDGIGSWWVSNLGHNHPAITAAISAQLEKMAHVAFAGLAHEPGIRLAARLTEHAPPGLTRVFFSDNGSTAVEVALRAAFQFHAQNGQPKRTRFVSFSGAYHGDTIGTVAVGGVSTFHDRFSPLLFPVFSLPSPSGYDVDGHNAAVAALEALFDQHADCVAAVVLEPLIQGAAGMLMHAPDVVRQIHALCQKYGVFLIADEVFTGFGRTGSFFAMEQCGVTPDFLCCSKGLTAGALPFAATLMTEQIFDGFRGDPSRTFFYGHSYCGNPLGCAAALATIDLLAAPGFFGEVHERIAQMRKLLEWLAAQFPQSSVRQTGLVGALQLGGQPDYLSHFGPRFFQAALKHGAYLRPLGNVVYFVPALTISETELAELFRRAALAIEEALLPAA